MAAAVPAAGVMVADRLLIACTHALVAMQSWSWGVALLGVALQRRRAESPPDDAPLVTAVFLHRLLWLPADAVSRPRCSSLGQED